MKAENSTPMAQDNFESGIAISFAALQLSRGSNFQELKTERRNAPVSCLAHVA